MQIVRTLFAATLLATTATAWSDNLIEIYELALVNDPTLSAAEAGYLAGKEAANIGRAGLLPNIAGSYSYSEANGNADSVRVFGENAEFASKGDVENDTETAMVTLRQPLFDLSAWYEFQQGKQLGEQARLTFAAEKQQQILTVATAYFDVLRASENLNSAIAEEKAVGRQLQQTKERFDVGLLPITDVHEAQAAYDNALVNTLEARGALNIAFEGLEVLTGQSHNELSGLASTFPTPPPEPADVSEWVTYAMSNNLTLLAQKSAMGAADANARARKSDHLPTVTGSVSYNNINADGESFNFPTSDDQEGNQAMVEFNMPIFTGGLTSANRRQANQLAIQAQEQYRATQRSTTQQTRSQHLLVITNAARVQARNQAITSAESALEATQAGYDVGTRNIVDVLNAQRVLYQAKRDYANARYDYIGSLLQLKQDSGQLNPEDLSQLNRWLDPSIQVVRAGAR